MTKITINKAALTAMVEKNIRVALRITGEGLVEKVRASMVPGTGRSYTKGGSTHVASSPGSPPAPWSGRLHDSITFYTNFGDHSSTGPSAESGDGVGKPKGAMGGHVVVVGSNVSYALAMERGEKLHKVAARPYLWPALKGSRELIKKAFERV